MNHIADEMVTVLASSVVDREFGFRSGQINDYKVAAHSIFKKEEQRLVCTQSG